MRAADEKSEAGDPAVSGTNRGLDRSCLSHLLGYRITQANLQSRRAFQLGVGTPFKLSPVEFTILALLAHNPDATPKQLAQALAVSAPAVTTLLDRLAERELLVRVRSEADRRTHHLRLSRKGGQLARQALEVSRTMERELVRHLSEAERAILMELLQKVARGRRG